VVTGSAETLRISVVRTGKRAVVRLDGELDLATAGDIDVVLHELEVGDQPPPQQIVIDAEQLIFIDAAGLNPLLRAVQRLPAGTLRLRNVRPPVLRVLRLLDLADQFGLDS
jgi:anti-anti-sigma factor